MTFQPSNQGTVRDCLLQRVRSNQTRSSPLHAALVLEPNDSTGRTPSLPIYLHAYFIKAKSAVEQIESAVAQQCVALFGKLSALFRSGRLKGRHDRSPASDPGSSSKIGERRISTDA